MPKQMIKDIKSGDAIDSDFMVGDLSVMDTKNGKKMGRVDLIDKSGKVSCVMWDFQTEAANATHGESLLKTGRVVHINGTAGEYQGKPQIIIAIVTSRESTTNEDFEKVSKYSVSEMWYEFLKYVHGFDSAHIKTVAQDIVLNEDRVQRFMNAPAATGMHHAFKGGLLEHTLQMLQTGEALLKLPFYKEALNADLCMFGLMFHDFSKMYEYSADAGFKKTTHGILVGHIAKTAALIEVSCDKFGVPDEIKDFLQHVVLAHHGRVDYGSPVDMAIPEAQFVHFIDHLHGDVFGTVQKFETEAKGQEIWKHPVTRKNMVVTRFSDVLKSCES